MSLPGSVTVPSCPNVLAKKAEEKEGKKEKKGEKETTRKIKKINEKNENLRIISIKKKLDLVIKNDIIIVKLLLIIK